MKSMKTKLGLSVLALACLGAGVMTMQPSVGASAEETTATVNYATGLTMVHGAAVKMPDADNASSGIRWTTNVSADFFTTYGATNVSFGVIVAPTDKITGELTHATSLTSGSVKDLPYGGTFDGTAFTYYSAIDYNDIPTDYRANGGTLSDQEVLANAYALELTARAYAKVDDVYYYANLSGMNTSRSARQVAAAATLEGEDSVESYYGKLTKLAESNGAVGTPYIDMQAPTATVTASIAIEGNFQEAMIGAEKIGADYADGTLTITEANYIPEGEQYITVFTDSGVYATPVIGATKVLKTTDDLTMFNAKGKGATVDGTFDFVYTTKYQYLEYWAPEQEQGGYYVLGNNIEAEGYVHGSKSEDGTFNGSTWNGADKYAGYPIGLTGTFNGMGYAIKDMEIGSEYEGFFGIVNGGTVKNVAFTDVKSQLTVNAYVVAHYLLNATLENVYVRTDAYETDTDGNVTSVGFPMKSSAGLAHYYYGRTSMTSCVVEFSASSQSGLSTTDYKASAIRQASTGILFSNYRDDYGADDANEDAKSVLTCADVYGVSGNKYGAYTQTFTNYRGTKNDAGTWEGGVMMGDSADASVVPSDTNAGTREDGCYVKVHGDPRHFLTGAYRYDTLDIMKSAAHEYTTLVASNCWTVVEGLPVWKSTQS